MLEFELESWDPLHIALSSVMWRTLLFLTSRQTCLHYCSLSLSFWINISSSVSLLMILACLLFCAFRRWVVASVWLWLCLILWTTWRSNLVYLSCHLTSFLLPSHSYSLVYWKVSYLEGAHMECLNLLGGWPLFVFWAFGGT